MLEKTEQANRVRAIRAYLEDIGLSVSQVQAREVLARALGLKNKHVLAAAGLNATSAKAPEAPSSPGGPPAFIEFDGKQVPVLPLGVPLTPAQMKALAWSIDVVVGVPLAAYGSDVETRNDAISMAATGDENALYGFGTEHVPQVNFGIGFIAVRATGTIDDPAQFFAEARDDADSAFYTSLEGLYHALINANALRVDLNGRERSCAVRLAKPEHLALLVRYARIRGDNNEAVNAVADEVVLELESLEGHEPAIALSVEHLKYAQGLDGLLAWALPLENGRTLRLQVQNVRM